MFHHHGRQSLRVKHGFVFEHEIDGAGQLDGQDRIGFEFVAAHQDLEALGHRSDEVMIPFGNDGAFAKGPAQVGVAQFGAAQALDLAGAGHRAFDQAAVAQEIFDSGEAGDVADFVEDGHAEVFADARDGLEEGILARSRFFGEPMELLFDGGDLGVVTADHGQFIFEGQLAQGMIFVGQELFEPGFPIGSGLADERAVIGQLMGLDAGQQIGALPDKEQALTQESASGTFIGGIDVGRRDEVGA